MDLLEGAAAFTVVMIVLSTVVSGIVEVILRATATRPAVVVAAVRSMLEGHIAKLVTRIGAEPDKDLVWKLVGNPLKQRATRIENGKPGFRGWVSERLALSSSVVDTVTTYAFLQRLAKSELGAKLADRADAELEPLLQDLSRTYERHVAAANELFRKNANTLGAFVAVALAFAINLDATRVFTYLMNTPDARAALIDSAEAAAAANETALESLNELIAKLERGDPETGAAELGYRGANGEEIIAAVNEDMAKIRADLEPLLAQAQLPIGLAYYPYCVVLDSDVRPKPVAAGAPPSAACASVTEGETKSFWAYARMLAGTGAFWMWVFNVIVAGLLVSLGGPFWYKVFTSLSGLLQMARSLTGGRSETIQAKPGAASDQRESDKALAEKTLSETFRIASGVPAPAP